MFSILSLATLALSALSASNALVIPRATAPSSYRTDILEPYAEYNARYMAIGCQSKHNTPFFDACCHPLKVGETVEKNRPAECRVAASGSSAAPTATSVAAQPSASADPEDEDDGDCDEDEPESSVIPNTTAAPSPSHVATTSVAPTTAPATSVAHTSATHTSTPVAPKPEPTTSKAAPTSNQAAPTPKASSPAPASDSQIFSGGFATYFFQNGVAGACGTVHSDSDLIAAIDQDRYGNSGVKSSLCGKQVRITNANNGKSVTVTIADDCPTCKNGNSIDLSHGAFLKIATEAEGMVPIKWSFI
ncbi:barwin-like endoglucanase [Panus rudis PR-1116 ss-1]|nr:barwin-like endoglucanase [Panus rudis PR-1116 ss-1]